MDDQTEQIEAKLAAYVDGELHGAELQEIEQHLAANPSHRALIDDLMAQKRMLRQLPREASPSDLTENLQGHLEREALLSEGDAGESAVIFQINRRPQLLAAAAIILMTIGLAIVVYSTLPSRSPIAVVPAGEESYQL